MDTSNDRGTGRAGFVEAHIDKVSGLLCTIVDIHSIEVHKGLAGPWSSSREQYWLSSRFTKPIMTDAAKISSANQNPWTTTGTTTGTRIPTNPNVMFYDHGQSSVEPTTTLESAADEFFAGWNGQMTEPQQQSQQQYHLSQHQNHRTQTQPSHHGMAFQNLVYPDYPSANTTTFQPPVSMTGALDIQPADHHVTDEHLLQAPYYDPVTSVVSNEEPYVARLPDPGWTLSAEAQRAATKRSKLDSFDG